MLKIILGTLVLLFYLFPTGILASGLVTEMTVSGVLDYSQFYKTRSFLLIILYTIIYFVVLVSIFVFKNQITSLLDKGIQYIFEREELKELTTDIQVIKSSLNKTNLLPKTIFGTKNTDKIICILTPSPLFVFGSITSIYYCEDGYEKLIALGKVYNIQEDLKIQIEVVKVLDDENNQQVIEAIGNNDATKLNRIIVKPNVSLEYILNN